VSIQERVGKRIRFLLVGGIKYDFSGPLNRPPMPLDESKSGKVFPIYQDRSIRPDPLGMRQRYPNQSVGVKVLVTPPNSPQHDDPVKWMIFAEMGLDQLDIVMDTKAWCRIFRYTFMTADGGFDSRWWSGDYGKHIVSDMLLHPNDDFNVKDCLQTPKHDVLDESYFPSSDLLNATIRITHFHFCIPGSECNDIRSFDVHIRSDEIVVKTSSELPRTLVNEVHTSQIEFPHDPSDIGFTLRNLDTIGSGGQNETIHIPSFRFQTNFRGLSIQFSPIVPFLVSQEPEQFLSPTDVTIIFCLEERLLCAEQNESFARLLVSTSIVVHSFVANLDLDVLAAALVTVLVHCDVIEEFASCSFLKSTNFDDANVRVQNSLRDRMDLLQRRVNQCKKDGRVLILLNLNVIQSRLCLWRQNVPRKPPCQHVQNGSFQIAPFLKLFDLSLNDITVCIEACEDDQYRSVVGKLSALDMELDLCDIVGCVDLDDFWIERRTDLKRSPMAYFSDPEMIKSIALKGGNENSRAIAARVEYRREKYGSLSFAADFCDGFIVSRVDVVESILFLLIDALFVPCHFPRNITSDDGTQCAVFPYGTVGYLFASIASRLPSIDIPSTVDGATGDLTEESFSSPKFSTTVQAIFAKIVARNINIILFRVGIAKIDLCVSDSSLDSGHFRLKLDDCNVLFRYICSDDFKIASVFDIFARKQQKWSTLWLHMNEGCYYGVSSRQSVVYVEPGYPESGMEYREESVLGEFGFNCVFNRSKLLFDMVDDISIGNSIKLERFFVASLRPPRRLMQLAPKVSERFKFFVSTKKINDNGINTGAKSKSISLAFSSVLESLEFLEDLFRSLKQNACALRDTSKSTVLEKDREITELRMKVFLKEKERLATFALFCSDSTGWLRIGTAERSGPRGLMSCMLWPHWVVLRRSLLLVYTSPGLVRSIVLLVLACL
jgi:hypothetical protein